MVLCPTMPFVDDMKEDDMKEDVRRIGAVGEAAHFVDVLTRNGRADSRGDQRTECERNHCRVTARESEAVTQRIAQITPDRNGVRRRRIPERRVCRLCDIPGHASGRRCSFGMDEAGRHTVFKGNAEFTTARFDVRADFRGTARRVHPHADVPANDSRFCGLARSQVSTRNSQQSAYVDLDVPAGESACER